MRWRTICFDLDNTLFSHEVAFEKAICFCFAELQQQWIQQKRIKSKIGISMWFKTFKKNSDLFWRQFETKEINAKTYRRLRYFHTMKRFQLPYSDEEADAFHTLYYDIVDSFSEPFEGLNELMNILKKREITLGIITNGTTDTQYRKVEKIGLSKYIEKDQIFVSEELGVAKPNREIFDLAIQKLGGMDEKLFIGDAWEHDICGAINAGWDAIYLNSRGKAPSTNHQTIASFTKLSEVLNFFKSEQSMKG